MGGDDDVVAWPDGDSKRESFWFDFRSRSWYCAPTAIA